MRLLAREQGLGGSCNSIVNRDSVDTGGSSQSAGAFRLPATVDSGRKMKWLPNRATMSWVELGRNVFLASALHRRLRSFATCRVPCHPRDRTRPAAVPVGAR